jgi:hypothetical protein
LVRCQVERGGQARRQRRLRRRPDRASRLLPARSTHDSWDVRHHDAADPAQCFDERDRGAIGIRTAQIYVCGMVVAG